MSPKSVPFPSFVTVPFPGITGHNYRGEAPVDLSSRDIYFRLRS
jgi:hypothetical protein